MKKTHFSGLVASLFAVLAWAAPEASAQRMPRPSKVSSWRSPASNQILKTEQEGLPEYQEKTLPDGSKVAPRAPWPFLLLVIDQQSDDRDKLEERVLTDTRFVLATHAVRMVRVRPDQVLDLPYLKRVEGIRDPTLIGIDRDFQVVGVLNNSKSFDERGVLPLLEKLNDTAYDQKLAAYVSAMHDVLESLEKVYAQEEKLSTLEAKAGAAQGAQQAKIDAECDEIEKEIESAKAGLTDQEQAARALLVLRADASEATPTTLGKGLSKRKLTPEEQEAIETFRQFSRDENPIVRAAAVEDLGALDTDAIVHFVLEAANDTDLRVVQAAGKALARMRSDAALTAITAALSSGGAKERAAALYGFAGIDRPWPAAVPAIVEQLRQGEDDVRRAAVQALTRQGDASSCDALVTVLDDRVPALRVMAADTLGELKVTAAVSALCAKLDDSDWALQKSAAEALGKIRSRDSIVPLLEHFEKADGVQSEVLYRALVAVTGQDFSPDPAGWRSWWDRYADVFQLPSDDQIAEAKARAEKNRAAYSNPAKKTYHQIETLSKRMIFVIDVSASMNDKIVVPAGTTDADLAQFPSRIKMEIAKNELIELLGNLESDVKFNIITFAGEVEPWKNGLVGASARNAAIKYVAKLEAMQAPAMSRRPGGAAGGEELKTNTYGALLAAFGLTGDGTDWKSRPDADTVFLVTDGLPTTGEIVDVPKLIDAITELNRGRGVTLHLIMFDKDVADRLRPLADRNGGQCVVRGFR